VGLSESVSSSPVYLSSSNLLITERYSYLNHVSLGDISSIQKCGTQEMQPFLFVFYQADLHHYHFEKRISKYHNTKGRLHTLNQMVNQMVNHLVSW